MIRNEIPTVVRGVVGTFEYRDGLTPAEISNGNCDAFAWELHDLLEQLGFAPVVREMTQLHFWIECNGKHYDAETPDGVRLARNLPFYMRKRKSRV